MYGDSREIIKTNVGVYRVNSYYVIRSQLFFSWCKIQRVLQDVKHTENGVKSKTNTGLKAKLSGILF